MGTGVAASCRRRANTLDLLSATAAQSSTLWTGHRRNVQSLAQFVPYLAEATGRRYVETKIPVELGRTHVSAAKARALLRYVPRYLLFDMVDEAIGCAKGR